MNDFVPDSYTLPITAEISTTQQLMEELSNSIENKLYCSLKNFLVEVKNIKVDEEELKHALAHDMNAYCRGYADAKKEQWISTRDKAHLPRIGQKVLLGFSQSYEKSDGDNELFEFYGEEDNGHELRGRVVKANYEECNYFNFSLYGENDIVGDDMVSGDDKGLYWQPLPKPPKEKGT